MQISSSFHPSILFRTLDEKARNIYKENVDLTESLRIYKRELDNLEKGKEQLNKQVTSIMSDKEMNDLLVKDKIEQAQKQNQTIKEVENHFSKKNNNEFLLEFF